MAWPRATNSDEAASTEGQVGIASSAAGTGTRGAATPLLVWCGYWSLAAVLFLLPDTRTPTSISSAIIRHVARRASGYSHFLNSFGTHFGHDGVGTTWLFAIASLIVGFGPCWCVDRLRSCSLVA